MAELRIAEAAQTRIVLMASTIDLREMTAVSARRSFVPALHNRRS
jgi:hypothetical protein